VVVISLWHVPESRDRETTGRIDLQGALLATIGLGGVVYGLIESSRAGFFEWRVLAAIAIGLVALASFVFVEMRVKSPMLPLKLFRSRNFSGTNILTLLLYFALGGGLFFLTLNLIQVQGFSPTAAGAALLPFVFIMFGLSRWSGGLVARFGPRLPLLVGPTIAAAGFALFAMPGNGAGYWSGFFPGVVVLGLGMAISVAPLTTTIMSSVPQSQAGVASGINNAVSRTAGLLAIAVLGVVMLQVFSSGLKHRLASLNISEQTRNAIYEQRIKLGGIDVDATAAGSSGPAPINEGSSKQAIEQAIKDSFVSGFRTIMLIAAAMALASTFSTRLLLEKRPAKTTEKHPSR